jgi:ATP-dependent RNA circularization protein (DNA/RNA ligase family)
LNIKAVEGGHILQLSFSIKFINENEIQQFISALEKLGSLTDINLITAKNDVEY